MLESVSIFWKMLQDVFLKKVLRGFERCGKLFKVLGKCLKMCLKCFARCWKVLEGDGMR